MNVDIFLLLLVAAFLVYRFLGDKAEEASKDARDTQKISMRRAALIRSPDSPSSHEFLGDALQEADRYTEALTCYETAARIMEASGSNGSGQVGGGGLDNKIRLVKLDIKESAERPASYVDRIAQREIICRPCGTLNAPNATHCVQCGAILPTNTFLETWHRNEIRGPILREVREGAIMLLVVLIALYLANWMPLEIKGVLLISTICVLVWKGMRAITDK